MNRLPIRRHGRLLECFRQRRMRVTRPPHIFTRRTIFNRQHPLRDHLPRIRSHDMNPQYPIRLRIRYEFDQSLRFQIRLRP